MRVPSSLDHRSTAPLVALRVDRARLVIALFAVALLALAAPLRAQSPEPGALKAGQPVEVEYTPGSGRWLAATVVEVLNDGYAYKVAIAPGQDAAESRPNIHFRRVRAAAAAAPPARVEPAPPVPPAPPATAAPALGKYACTESRYDAATGGYAYDAKGAFTLAGDGRYSYLAFARPSAGRYRVDRATGRMTFTGGHLTGGEATPVEGRPGRFYLTAPSISARWTCGHAGAR